MRRAPPRWHGTVVSLMRWKERTRLGSRVHSTNSEKLLSSRNSTFPNSGAVATSDHVQKHGVPIRALNTPARTRSLTLSARHCSTTCFIGVTLSASGDFRNPVQVLGCFWGSGFWRLTPRATPWRVTLWNPRIGLLPQPFDGMTQGAYAEQTFSMVVALESEGQCQGVAD
jgi:hypothetical protein